jgi:outer membrane receptor for ferrienterochelin and colicins
MRRNKLLVGQALLGFSASSLMSVALGQAAPAAPAAPAASAAAPAQAASAPAAKPATPAAPANQRIEITGGRQSETEQRRQSTASKIVIGREEIDKFGDATVGEVLRRLPGVTTPGAPGRGGPPRMRGLGGGFTQLLIDGQRVPPGFSLESLTPEQVERIEILRAPTAETGARAIAGTINIITREGFKLRLNDVRIGAGYENGQISPGINWSHNDNAGPLNYNVSASAFRSNRKSSGSSSTQVENLNTGVLLGDRSGSSVSKEQRFGVNLNGRLMWRLNDLGDSLSLMPSVFHSENHSDSRFDLVQRVRQAVCNPVAPVQPCTPAFFDTGSTVTDGRFTTGRLGAMWRQRMGDARLELNGNAGLWKSRNDSLRNEFDNGVPAPKRTLDDRATTGERSLNLTLKLSGLAGGGQAPAAAGAAPATPATPALPGMPPAADRPVHNLVGGAEIEAVNRDETRISVPAASDFGDNLKASSLRLAAYVQDEWQLSPQWGLHGGLRWEGITTRGDSGQGARPTNRSSVWTPLLHAVWRPDPKSRDQVRVSLTRSYRSPPLGSLIGRPTFSRDYPVSGPNIELQPDSAGNAALKPELATGIDVALERYLDSGGVLSANLFHRNISNLIRGQVDLESVSWSPVQRYVRRQRNIGDATTSGLELEAKFRLDQLISAAPRIEMRSNFSAFSSRVKSVPGPDNRLDQQAKATANLGADYRLRGVPLTLGGNLNWVPGYTTRVDVGQTVAVSTKRVWDAYALWTISPSMGLRLLGSNLDPRDYVGTTTAEEAVQRNGVTQTERTTSRSFSPGYVNWQLRLELKL